MVFALLLDSRIQRQKHQYRISSKIRLQASPKHIILQSLRLNGTRYNACPPHLLSKIPSRSPCIGRFQIRIQTSVYTVIELSLIIYSYNQLFY